MTETLMAAELSALIAAVFPAMATDRRLAVLVDVPRTAERDNPGWRERRAIAMDWVKTLNQTRDSLKLEEVACVAYPDVGSNNADLPDRAFLIDSSLPDQADELDTMGRQVSFDEVFDRFQLLLSPTEYSTTAPLKNAARKHGFRAATMPGFSKEMLPALRIDYAEVSRRVDILKEHLDSAQQAEVRFLVDDEYSYVMKFDLRFRHAHPSSGRFPEAGTAGNVPSGEAYIVPYEGEGSAKSVTAGHLPVQIADEVVVYTVTGNLAITVDSLPGETGGRVLDEERDHLQNDPAYGNMAELGFGVLADFGITPIGELLLDEKLGFHIAFGRSDHFGGSVSPADFSSPESVIHLDRVYIRDLQPRVEIDSIILSDDDSEEVIMKSGAYTLF